MKKKPTYADLERKIADLESEINSIKNRTSTVKSRKMRLEKAEKQFSDLFMSIPIGLYIVQNRKIRLTNPTFQKVTGYDENELLGMDSLEMVLPEDRALVVREAVDILKVARQAPYEFRIRSKQGDIKWIMSTVAPVEYKGKQAALGNFMETTQRKPHDEELLNIQKRESVGTLAGGIAHDFNNILTAIMGYITLAQLDVEPGSGVYEQLIEAEKAAIRATELTQKFMTFNKGAAPVTQRGSIVELLKDTVAFTLSGSKIKSEFSFSSNLRHVAYDEWQISQVINSMVNNAMEAMPEGGILRVSVENVSIDREKLVYGTSPEPGDYLKISFTDHGMGIPGEIMPKIFDPYFSTKERGVQKGMGLGLATDFSIIRNHGGYLGIESEVEVGTTVTILLPAVARAEKKAVGVIDIDFSTSGRILLMDDESMVRKVAGQMLARLGYEVDFAEDGNAAVACYREAVKEDRPYAAVILDLTIPGGMGAKRTIKKLRKADPDVKCVVSSGYSDDPVMKNFKKYGFAGAVAKPYSLDGLRQSLADLDF